MWPSFSSGSHLERASGVLLAERREGLDDDDLLRLPRRDFPPITAEEMVRALSHRVLWRTTGKYCEA
eukprot:8380463-Pyramimonas_sp.AAC.1